MTVKIRNARASDAEECAEIFIKGSKGTFNELWSKEDARKYLSEDLSHCKIRLCAADGKDILGFVIAYKFQWHDGERYAIKEIFVKNGYRGKGIGTALIEAVEKQAIEAKASTVELMTSKDAEAFKFYEKRGFRQNDFVFMEKKLNC